MTLTFFRHGPADHLTLGGVAGNAETVQAYLGACVNLGVLGSFPWDGTEADFQAIINKHGDDMYASL